MSNVVPLVRQPRVVIHAGLVRETRYHHSAGVSVVQHTPPVRRFFLDYEDDDGLIGVWDGESYAEALSAAQDWRSQGIAIVDRVAELRGHA